MIRALLLILNPMATWERVVRAHRGVIFILVFHVLPLLLLVSAVEGFGLVKWGEWQSQGLYLKKFARGEAIVFEGLQLLISVLVVFVSAWLVKAVGETFHGRHTFAQAFTAVAYGLGPMFLLRAADALPAISPWVGWGIWSIGLFLSFSVLYSGLPKIMEPDPPQAFGLYLMSVLLILLITGLVRFITGWYLSGKFQTIEHWISGLGQRLPV